MSRQRVHFEIKHSWDESYRLKFHQLSHFLVFANIERKKVFSLDRSLYANINAVMPELNSLIIRTKTDYLLSQFKY